MTAGLKRFREDDGDSDGYDGVKKLRTLPFRTSPTTQHTSLFFSNRPRPITLPQVLTPAESSDDDSDAELVSPRDRSRQPPLNLYLHTIEDDDDMDMDMTHSPQAFTEPVWSPKMPDSAFSDPFASPSISSRLTVSTATARSVLAQTPRIPTPIYGHFASLDTPSDSTFASPRTAPPTSAALPHPRIRTSTVDSQSDAFFRHRALPSPISEDENMDSPTVMTKAMLSNLKMSATPSSDTFPENSLMTPETPGFMPKHWMNAPGLTPGRNRRRSDAISGGAGESGKIVFSMGFRADCEKCRERVPGHYSHVLRA